MTVCVAAICDGFVVGASDRMLTYGDIVEFEPSQPKFHSFTSSIVVMWAGDAAFQREILQEVFAEVNGRVKADPTNWWRVRDVAEVYRKHYNRARFARAEQAILSPLGLDAATFYAKQRELAPQLVGQITERLAEYAASGVETLIVGNDTDGHHIYRLHGGEIFCEDATGYAAIGVGAWHASSRFMFARHGPAKPFAETLWLTYSAKRRAEVAPGIGPETDMFVVGPLLGTYTALKPEVLEGLGRLYELAQRDERRSLERARTRMGTYLTKMSEQAGSTQQATPAGDASVNVVPGALSADGTPGTAA